MGQPVTEPYGEEALNAWNEAMSFVEKSDYAAARAVRLFKSDYIALEKAIQRREAKFVATANANGNCFNSQEKS